MNDGPRQMGSVCRSSLWAEKVSRDGRLSPGRGSEITHSIYGSLRGQRLTDLAISREAGRQLAVQSRSQGQTPPITVLALKMRFNYFFKALFCLRTVF